MDAAAQPPKEQPRLSSLAIVMIFIAALAGRFSIDRIAITGVATPDTRVIGAAAVIVVVYFWRIGQRPIHYQHRWPVSAFWTFALLGSVALAAFWAPSGARVVDRLIDLAVLAVFVGATAIATAPDPRRAADLVLKLMLGAAVVYALGALAAGPGIQGRYSAFGGGPNVFARVICMGMIASLTLYTRSRRKLLLIPLPLLGVATFLSGSRGGLVSLVLAVTLFLPAILRRTRTSTVVFAMLTGGLLASGIWQYASSMAAGVGYRFTDDGIVGGGFSSRPELLQYAWRTYWEHPLIGAGMDVFYVERGQFVGLGYVHNLVGAVSTEAGLAGLICLALAAWTWLRDGRPWRDMPVERLGCALAAVFIALESMVSGDYYDTRWMWIIAIIAVNQPSTSIDVAPAVRLPPIPSPTSH